METNYEESYRRIMEYQNEEHLRNQKKIRWGIRCVILIPMIFLMLMFSMDSSKVVFLVLWIVSLFTISAYLIYVEYMDYTLQERLTELGIKEDGKIDTLLQTAVLTAGWQRWNERLLPTVQSLQNILESLGLCRMRHCWKKKRKRQMRKKILTDLPKNRYPGTETVRRKRRKKTGKRIRKIRYVEHFSDFYIGF